MNNNTESLTVTVNENLVKFDNLMKALDYLVQEVETRKDQFLSTENINEELKNVVESDSFRRSFFNYICDSCVDGIVREVAFYVMEKIDDSIEEFINDRVSKALLAAGIAPNNQASA